MHSQVPDLKNCQTYRFNLECGENACRAQYLEYLYFKLKFCSYSNFCSS